MLQYLLSAERLACGGQCGQVAARQMVEQNRHTHTRGGAIINMSSVNAVMAIPSIAGYNASKGGVNNLTRCVCLHALALHVQDSAQEYHTCG